MKITKKFTLAGLSSACALSLAFGVGMLANTNGVAKAEESNAPDATVYFYDNLIDADGKEYTLAKKFYSALEDMNKNGDFVDGVVDYNISNIVTSDQLKGWVVDGNLEVPKAFSAARDAFLTDHPELFYINFYKMTISVAKSGGNYVGFLNSGREANLYYENGFNTTAQVEEAITKYEARVDEIVDIVNKLEADDTYSARDVFLAREVNRYLAENIEYDYVAYENQDDPDYVAAAYINTPYGGLVEGRAVCGGYSTSYKVIMDKLGIPCITVNGYSNNKDENGNNSGSAIYHMWNNVWLETPSAVAAQSKSRAVSNGAWYSVDVTWDSASPNKYRYAVMNADVDESMHVTDGKISSSGYELTYPELSVYSYGNSGKDKGFSCSLDYIPTGETDDYGNPKQKVCVSASYNGKSAKRLLEEDGLYLAYRSAAYISSEEGLYWEDWASLAIFLDFALEGGIYNQTDVTDNGYETRYYENNTIYAIQFAVFDVRPDICMPNGWTGVDPGFDIETQPNYFYRYSNDLLNSITPVAVISDGEASDKLINKSYGTYTPPPFVDNVASIDYADKHLIADYMGLNNGTKKMNPNYAFELTVSYDEPLHILKPELPIGVSFTSAHPNAQKYAYFVPFSDGALVHFDGDRTLTFKFCPSLMYEHDDDIYSIWFTNIGSAKQLPVFGNGLENEPTDYKTSDKLPNCAVYGFARTFMACPARFNYDGRLWVECCAEPVLVSNSDLSAMDFLDEDGNSTFTANERSQMMLVAEKADDATENEILGGIEGIEGSNVSTDNIKAYQTYDITLHMCNSVPKIPDGSYVRMGLGFPDGYGPESEGVTFKIYHRKHIGGDEYIIEEIPCVVTQYGIVAVVTSFSPYMVAAVDADTATERNVFATIEGKGGKLTNEDGRIISFKEGDTHTYTIQPDAGYLVYSVTLNGKSVLDKLVNGKLTLGYNDLDGNNELVIQYIANEAAARIQQKLDSSDIDEALEVGKHVVDVKGNVSENVSMPGYTVNTDSFVKVDPIAPSPDDGDNDNDNSGDDEANVPGPSTGINDGDNSSNTTAIVIAVVCVVIALAAAGAVVVVILRKKKNQ